MTYQVTLKEHSFYRLQFDSEQEFREWEEQGCCVSDLNYQDIIFQKSDIDITPAEDNDQ
jgi:hypothetical protein|tara:strand:+ start:199 stop:375 length:177 start_codon:yes stop_codon:yes gene_type:complete